MQLQGLVDGQQTVNNFDTDYSTRTMACAPLTASQSQSSTFILLLQPAAHERETQPEVVTRFHSPAWSRVFPLQSEFLSFIVSSAFLFH